MAAKVLGGRYTVQDRIGTGGMAIVYRGLDEVLGRTVAIKTMLPQYASDPSFAARFKQEAQAAAALQSPYIVSVYDWGKDGDTYYIVMEYLRGTDLKSGIRKHGALECKKVAQIGSQIAQALSVAHRHEIIHRDIKPQNIMVQPDGNIKVMDFGIARAKNSHLTTDNSVLGTAHYVSPEQTQGKELGPTTDIYSLGIVMYESATGKVPFEGDDAISVALKQVNEQPKPPSQINPRVDPALESIILKCMQKDPAARFQTADELYHTLRDYMAGRFVTLPDNGPTTVLPNGEVTVIKPAVNNDANGRRRGGRGTGGAVTAVSQREAEARRRKERRRRVFTILGFIALLAAVGTAIALYLSNANAVKTVPNLLNMTQAQALQAINEDDFFEVGEVTSEYSDTIEEGYVMDQDPKGGKKAERGTSISIVVSKGEQPKKEVEVPDLTNKTSAEARKLIEDRGLVAVNGDPVNSETIEKGKVAEQSPKGGSTAKEGDTVTYHISMGAEEVAVPDVLNDYEQTAVEKLEAAGFKVNEAWDYSDTYGAGVVCRQSTAPGETLPKGSTVTITISNGPEPVSVPNTIGSDQATATTTLQNAGFTVTVVEQASDTDAAGTVIDQYPIGDISSSDGKTVTITVSTGPAAEQTPENTTTPSEDGEGGEGEGNGGNGNAGA